MVVVVVYWLSIVKDVDKIVVLEKGWIVEEGIYEEFVWLDGCYLELICN